MSAFLLLPPSAPGAPEITSVAAGNAQANIYFQQPDYDGGSQIISYTVASNSGHSVSGDTVPITVSGLVNGRSYSFFIRATNAVGTGPASEESISVTPGIVFIDDAYATGYQLLQVAYDADVLEKKIKILAEAKVGELAVSPANVNGSIIINGGYNDAFSDDDGLPAILSKITLSAGMTRLKNVVVRSP